MAFIMQERESKIQDLRAHIKDWKGHSVDEMGPLYLYQVLTVRREPKQKEYGVYLFDKALLFVFEEVKDGSRILHLKGRFYMKSIDDVAMVPGGEEMKIKIFSDGKEAFALLFKEISMVYRWFECLKYLVATAKVIASREVDVVQQQESDDETKVQTCVEAISEKNIDIESQTHLVEEKEAGTTKQTKLGGKRWAMVGMLLLCFTLQGFIMTHLFARTTEFVENNDN